MTEKEYQQIIKRAVNGDMLQCVGLSFECQADIARQLTRIADAQDRLKTAEMLLCRIDKTNFTSCETKEDFLHIDVSQGLTREIHRFCETVSGETFTAAMLIHNRDYDPTPDVPTDVPAGTTAVALVEAVKKILNRSIGGGAVVINCVEHSPMKILERPEDCKLCQTDVKNKLSYAFGVNKFLNQQTDDIESALAAHKKAVKP